MFLASYDNEERMEEKGYGSGRRVVTAEKKLMRVEVGTQRNHGLEEKPNNNIQGLKIKRRKSAWISKPLEEEERKSRLGLVTRVKIKCLD